MAEHHIVFAADITPDTANGFISILTNLIGQNATRAIIAVNSSGGNVVSGITMYNVMRAMPYPITTHNIGNVDSISNVLFLGGEERYACAASTFMFHGVGFNGNANERLEENILKAKLDTVLSDHKRISGILSDRTQDKLTVRAGMKLFKEQRTRNAEWALDKGLINEIRDFTFPAGGNVHLIMQQS